MPNQANALTMYSNTTTPDDLSTHTYASGTTTVSGTIQYVDVSIGQVVSSNPNWSYELQERSNTTGVFGTCNSIDALTAAERNVPLLTLNSKGTETRIVTFQMAGAGCTKSAGQKASFYLYVNGNIVGGVGRFGGSGTVDETGAQYLVLRTTDSSTTTRITAINTPYAGQTSTTTNVVFDFNYFNNDTDEEFVEYSGVEMINVTNQSTSFTIEQPIITSGGGTYRRSIPLISSNQYMWRPYLRSSSGNRYVYGDFTIFNVVSNPNPNSEFTLEATTTDMEEFNGQFFQYFNLISLIQNKYPVSYIPQMIAVFNEELTNGTTTEFPSLELEFDYNGTATVTLDAFSTTTIVGSLPEELVDQWKTLIAYMLYISFFSFIAFDFARMFRSKYD